MQIKKNLAFVIIFSLFCSSLSGFAKESSPLEERVKTLEQLLNQFQKLCLDEHGNILQKTIVIDKETAVSDGPVISCEEEELRLGKMIKSIKNEIEPQSLSSKTKDLPDIVSCIENQNATFPLTTSEEDLSKTITDLANTKSAEGQNCQKQSTKECIEDLACNVIRSGPVIAIMSLLKKKAVGKSSAFSSCLDTSKSTCASEFVAGVIKDVWFNIDSVWELAKLAGRTGQNLTKKAWIKTWSFFSGVENKTSDAALAASKQSDGAMELFKKDPWAFIKQMIGTIGNLLNDSIKNNFGCEKWESTPHLSKCLQPMSNWDCATCGQKENAICGITGVLGGELATAFLTGGAVNVGGKVLSKGAAATAKVNEILITAIPKIEKVETAIKITSKGAASLLLTSLSKPVLLAKKVINSEICLKILNSLSKKTEPIIALTSKVMATKPLVITFKIANAAFSPITSYMSLTEKSFLLGMNQSEILAGKVSGAFSNFSQIMARKEDIKGVEEIVINTNSIEAMAPELLQSRLKEHNINYEEIVLPDGTKATRVKVNPACSISGKSSILFE